MLDSKSSISIWKSNMSIMLWCKMNQIIFPILIHISYVSGIWVMWKTIFLWITCIFYSFKSTISIWKSNNHFCCRLNIYQISFSISIKITCPKSWSLSWYLTLTTFLWSRIRDIKCSITFRKPNMNSVRTTQMNEIGLTISIKISLYISILITWSRHCISINRLIKSWYFSFSISLVHSNTSKFITTKMN